jgi:CubicO group peptidase (beta-lactamase class C family)
MPCPLDALAPLAARLELRAGACVLVQGDRMVHATFGDQAPASTAAFYLASVSKAYTATAVCLAHALGGLNLDAPLRQWLPELSEARTGWALSATLRDALSMRLGLATQGATHFGFAPDMPVAERIRRGLSAATDQPFRYAAGYHNIGPIMARLALERATGHSILPFLRREAWDPGAFAHTDALDAPNEQLQRVPLCVRTHHGPREVPLLVGTHSSGAGGVFTSITDAGEWLRLQLGMSCGQQPVAIALALSQAHAPQALYPAGSDTAGLHTPWLAYGMGWQVCSLQGQRFLLHSGRVPGGGAMSMLLPDMQTGITVLLSGSAAAAALLAAAVLNQVVPGAADLAVIERSLPPPVTPATDDAGNDNRYRGWVGDYHQHEAGPLTIHIRDGAVRADFADCPMYSGRLRNGADGGVQIVPDLLAPRLDPDGETEHRLVSSPDGRSLRHPWLGTFPRQT